MKISIANPGLAGLALVVFFAGGCGEGEPPPRVYDVPVQSGAEVRADLHLACSEAVASGVPVLVEFSAPWCSDCQQLHRMRQQEALAAELEYWPAVDINVGHFDRHEDLLGAFGVRSIAHWVVLEPTDCDVSGRGLGPRRRTEARTRERSRSLGFRRGSRRLARRSAELLTPLAPARHGASPKRGTR